MDNTTTLTLDRLMQRDANRLDFIRFLAALGVIYAHSFPLGVGTQTNFREPLHQIFGLDLGTLGVAVFFIISGFLITASIERSHSVSKFLKARFLRIYPALFVLVLLTIFILGPLFSSLSVGEYFANGESWGYFRVLLLYKTSYFLPGVFEANVYPDAVNGSLWTLFFEVVFYFFVLALFLIRGVNRRLIVFLFFGVYGARFFLLELYPLFGLDLPLVEQIREFFRVFEIFYGTRLLMFFLTGMAFYILRDQIVMRRSILIVCALLFIPFRLIGAAEYWLALPGAYCLLYLAILPGRFTQFSKRGDFSYGLYIYAFPVQQSLTHLVGGSMNPVANFVVASMVTLGFAVLSWHLVEKPALTLKNVQLYNPFAPRIATEPTASGK